MKNNNKKGFTLAELLIVVAIIAVLVAIAIPVFTSQLEKSRDAVTVANLRAAYAEAAVEVLSTENKEISKTVKAMGSQDGLTGGSDLPFTITDANDKLGKGGNTDVTVEFNFTNAASVTCTVK